MLDLSPSLQVVVDSPKDDADLRVVVGEGLAAGCPACSRNLNFNPSRSMKSLTLKGFPHFYLATLDVPVAHSVGWACLLCCMLLKSLSRNLVGLVRQHVESPVVRSSNSWCWAVFRGNAPQHAAQHAALVDQDRQCWESTIKLNFWDQIRSIKYQFHKSIRIDFSVNRKRLKGIWKGIVICAML